MHWRSTTQRGIWCIAIRRSARSSMPSHPAIASRGSCRTWLGGTSRCAAAGTRDALDVARDSLEQTVAINADIYVVRATGIESITGGVVVSAEARPRCHASDSLSRSGLTGIRGRAPDRVGCIKRGRRKATRHQPAHGQVPRPESVLRKLGLQSRNEVAALLNGHRCISAGTGTGRCCLICAMLARPACMDDVHGRAVRDASHSRHLVSQRVVEIGCGIQRPAHSSRLPARRGTRTHASHLEATGDQVRASEPHRASCWMTRAG